MEITNDVMALDDWRAVAAELDKWPREDLVSALAEDRFEQILQGEPSAPNIVKEAEHAANLMVEFCGKVSQVWLATLCYQRAQTSNSHDGSSVRRIWIDRCGHYAVTIGRQGE